MTNRLTLDEAIAYSRDIAQNDSSGDLAKICHHAQLARWLTELKERRKLGYLPPCGSCQWKDRCTVTAGKRVAESWMCTMYEWVEA